MLSALPWSRSKASFSRRDEPKAESKRKDIQGLRAIAVGVVLLYHAGMPWLPGGFVGVDVFFVISGYLITGGVVKELRRNGTISLRGFYSRRVARILPAAALAIVSTLALTLALLPETRWRQIGYDGFASAFSYVNWIFASNSVNYLAQEQAESPFQHFWSLAVEEQFYMVWPLLLIVVGWLSLKLNFKLQKGMLVALALVAVPSFIWSVFLTETNPGAAYFVTTTRGWELAAGCALAIMAGRGSKQVPASVAAAIGWAGLAAIFLAVVTFTSATPFPSYTAALPVLGAVAVIWSGAHAGRVGPALLLNLKPMVSLGNISYSVYLWHWPLLVIAAGVWGKLDVGTGLAVVALSIIPAWLSYVAVENPMQNYLKESQGYGPAGGTGVMLVSAAGTVALLLSLLVPPVPPASTVQFVPTPIAGAEAKPVGAETIMDPAAAREITASFPNLTPAPVQAANDLPTVNKNGCMQDIESSEARRCDFGKADGTKTIAVVGDSHAAMLLPGFEQVAIDKGWKIISYTKGACPWVEATVNYNNKPFTQCDQWVANVTAALASVRPDVIIAGMSHYRTNSGTVDNAERSNAELVNGMRSIWAPFLSGGVKIVSVRDTPQPGVVIPDCVAKNLDELGNCAVKKAEVVHPQPAEVTAAQGVKGASVLDLTDSFCFGDTCPAAIGGVLVYRDSNHLTATYARSLHGQMAAALTPVVESAP